METNFRKNETRRLRVLQDPTLKPTSSLTRNAARWLVEKKPRPKWPFVNLSKTQLADIQKFDDMWRPIYTNLQLGAHVPGYEGCTLPIVADTIEQVSKYPHGIDEVASDCIECWPPQARALIGALQYRDVGDDELQTIWTTLRDLDLLKGINNVIYAWLLRHHKGSSATSSPTVGSATPLSSNAALSTTSSASDPSQAEVELETDVAFASNDQSQDVEDTDLLGGYEDCVKGDEENLIETENLQDHSN